MGIELIDSSLISRMLMNGTLTDDSPTDDSLMDRRRNYDDYTGPCTDYVMYSCCG